MTQSKSQHSNTGFQYQLNPDQTASVGFNNQLYGRLYCPYMAQIEETIDFVRSIEACYIAYHKAVTGGNRQQ